MGVETKPIKLVTKILPIMEHYVSTTFSVSEAFCRGSRSMLAGTGQRNVVAFNACRDSSRIMLKGTEK